MKFYIYTLGCKVNMYESNVMMDALKNAGYVEASKEEADIYIINTCTVTNAADNKSMKMVRQAIKQNPNSIIIVAGCMTQVNKEKAKIDGVDIILGNKNKSKIVEYIEEFKENQKQQENIESLENAPFETMKLNNFTHTRAFVKIEDGCNNYCSYCIIPYSRGSVRSKKREDVLEEVKMLIQNGHREIVLTGIHTGNYGAEFQNYTFSDLLTELIEIEGLERLRISSIEMNELTDNVLALMKKSPILVDHLHIPLQSGSDTILKAMNRKYLKQDFINKINEIRSIRPLISITTDVIVGFPGETEELFQETVETIRKINFSKLHVFPYSKRKGTVADTMENQISEEVKKKRVQVLLELSKQLEEQYFERFIGTTLSFIPEITKDNFTIGHTGNYLLVKKEGTELNNHMEQSGKVTKIEYPYVIME
ncbi:MAG: tRNA (N(6)-L-threonylcarbamoyladenosine(37)-C(2))-methylthiotransferase MtaB [Bacilli bacterium]|nr:tRNA (N(6)-L-threonylcarbamoyladenosine(37)-C(2))-methylthiotransferase MtaB [Bacilli bacterium]